MATTNKKIIRINDTDATLQGAGLAAHQIAIATDSVTIGDVSLGYRPMVYKDGGAVYRRVVCHELPAKLSEVTITGNYFYFGGDKSTNGTYRFNMVGNDMITEKRVSDSWVEITRVGE